MFSRKLILGAAAVLAVTGATGAAAVLAPSELGLSRLIPAVTAQTVTPISNNDLLSQLPFDRVAQAPSTSPSPTLTDAPTARAPARVTRTASRAPAVRDPAAQTSIAQAPDAQGPVAQEPIAQTPIATPRGRMIVTSGPGVVVQQHPQTRRVYRPRHVSRYEHCDD
jgi:hypothetical protein